MPRRKPAPQVALLLEALERAFSERTWHGHNLRQSLRGVTPVQAGWRPSPARHCIAEQVLHAVYWKGDAAAKISGEMNGMRILGKNWIGLPDKWNQAGWREVRDLANAFHDWLREVVSALRDRDLDRDLGKRVTVRMLLIGVAAHDAYHTGQIELLKRLYAESRSTARRGPRRRRSR